MQLTCLMQNKVTSEDALNGAVPLNTVEKNKKRGRPRKVEDVSSGVLFLKYEFLRILTILLWTCAYSACLFPKILPCQSMTIYREKLEGI